MNAIKPRFSPLRVCFAIATCGGQNDNKNCRCHAECSEASRFIKHDILSGILTPRVYFAIAIYGGQNGILKKSRMILLSV